MHINGQAPWRFRWVFDYSDGKLSKRGVWNSHSNDDPAASAFLQSKHNLLYAAIEAQDRDKTQVVRVAECPGQDFCNFEWIANGYFPGGFKGDMQLESIIVGISLITRGSEIKVYSSGETQISQRQYDDNLFHFGGLNNG